MKYEEFIASKKFRRESVGFRPTFLPDVAFDFQKNVIVWSCIQGRSAVFADCGLGKGLMILAWAENVIRHLGSNGSRNPRVLIAAPLAVAHQFVRESEKFGIPVKLCRDGKIAKAGIHVTNYHQLHKFDPKDFAGFGGDESGILKNHDGKMRRFIHRFVETIPYRFLGTATPAPNDYMELGSSSEVLGNMTRSQMLSTFFVNGGDVTQQWSLKGHAKKRFWEWVGSWAKAIRKPSDMGYSDEGYELPKLYTFKHALPSGVPHYGFLPRLAQTMEDQRAEDKRTVRSRCEKIASLVPFRRPCIVWCHRNDEADLLEKLIPDSVQVAGRHDDDEKEEKLVGFSEGKIPVLITKPKIAGFGLNWQHCNDVIYCPSHSHEMYYQAIRRCWRFGQKKTVQVFLVYSEANQMVVDNMLAKEKQASEMYAGIVNAMKGTSTEKRDESELTKIQLPRWLS